MGGKDSRFQLNIRRNSCLPMEETASGGGRLSSAADEAQVEQPTLRDAMGARFSTPSRRLDQAASRVP